MKEAQQLRRQRTRAGMLLLVSGSVAVGQVGLPPTAPTNDARSVSQLPSANPAPSRPAQHLAVVWDGVKLQVEATNVSLNAVLREIGQKTRMKVVGSAPDERVFGSYGPGPLNLVVPALLNGVAVNMLLTERDGGAADELVLTNRNGGATPSYVPTQQDTDSNSPAIIPRGNPSQGYHGGRPPGGFGGVSRAGVLPPNGNDPVVPDNGINGRDNGVNGPNNGLNGPDNGVNGRDNGQNGVDNGLNNSNAAANAAATNNTTVADPNANPNPTPDSATPASPNGVKTPQEIFEQLQKLRAQQQTQTPQ